MGMSSKSQVIGYEYYATVHSGIGLAMDELYRIDIGEKCAWAGSIKSNGSIYINQYNLFGGKKGEGGVQGVLDVMFGDENQGQNGNLTRYLGNAIPAFRNTVTTVFSGMLAAMNWYPKTWDFYYRRIKAGWPENAPFYPEKIEITLSNGQINAMNPAHILYESYISNTWGAGIPRAAMDDAAYKKVADTLYDEGFGLCFEWKATDQLKELRQYVCDHINAVLGTDPKTGKVTIRLIRDDYKVEDLPVFDEDTGLLEIKLQTSNNTEVPSQVIVKYNDAITFEERTAFASNPAVAQGQVGRNTETTEYLGLPTGELATRVAYRDLKAKTSGIKSATIKLDRRAFDIVNGQPFRIKTKYRINNIDMVVRATKRQEKFLTDGTITMEVVQDVFSMPKVAFMPVPDAPIRPEPLPPVAIIYSRVLEATYRDLAVIVEPANLALIDQSSGFIYAVAQSPANQCYSYDLVSRVKGSANFAEANDTGTWCPTAIITSDIGYTDRIIPIKEGQLLESVEVGSAALIDDEIVRIDAIDLVNNQLTVGRGCIDTVPAKHLADAFIWFYDSSETTDGVEYAQGNNVQVKLLSNTFRERLEQSAATTQEIAIQARQGRPYPPGNFKINNIAYPEAITDNAIIISWASRDRLIQADKLIDTTVGNTGLEPDTTFNLKVSINNVLTINETGITETSYELTSNIASEIIKDVNLLHFDNTIEDDSGLVWQQNGMPSFVDGKIGSNAIRFNTASSQDYLFLAKQEALNFKQKDFTLECWVKLAENPTAYGVIVCGDNASFGSNSTFLMYKSNKASPYYQQNKFVFGVYDTTIASTSIPIIGQWYHLAITRKNGVVSMFINGTKESSLAFTENINFALNGTYLGRSYYSGSDGFFKGDIDELRISEGCIYTDDFTPSIKPYTFNTGSYLDSNINIELSASRDHVQSWQAQKHHFIFKYKP